MFKFRFSFNTHVWFILSIKGDHCPMTASLFIFSRWKRRLQCDSKARGENGTNIQIPTARYAAAFRPNWPDDAPFLHFSFIKTAIMTNLICTAVKRPHHINMNVRKVAHFILSVSCKHVLRGWPSCKKIKGLKGSHLRTSSVCLHRLNGSVRGGFQKWLYSPSKNHFKRIINEILVGFVFS